MTLAVHTRAQVGIEAPCVTVEAHLPGGVPAFSMVGMAQTAVREARDRVKSAIGNSGLVFPSGRLVVNLAPADLAKTGSRYDLGIALSILVATGQITPQRLDQFEFVGELSLYGDLRSVRGCFAAGIALRGSSRTLVIPRANAHEFAHLAGVRVLPMSTLADVVALLHGRPKPVLPTPAILPPPPLESAERLSLGDVRGQLHAKRALAVAAAGGHHVLMIGPPGTGKTMLARRLAMLMPPLSEDEAIDVATIYSVAGRRAPRFGERPFRDPHHTASTAALVGGGNPPLPGEISMAHHGVLFLDELPEFQRDVLEALREPLESGEIVVARVNASTRYPAKFQLVAAMNPCPAGLVCDETRCRCTPSQVQRYRARISGPLLDRVDIHVEVGPVSEEEFWDKSDNDEGDAMRHLVQQTFKRQIERYGKSSRDFDTRELKSECALAAPELDLLKRAVQRFKLSARAIHRIQKLARTIADMEGEDQIQAVHLSEALTYRGRYFEPLM